jgi:hypothetical protein
MRTINVALVDSNKFWGKVNIGNSKECWNWKKGKTSKGYGTFYISRISMQAHRVAYALTFGDIPENMCVLHRCDNPACCNPSHLFLGTNQDNVDDKMQKGRYKSGYTFRYLRFNGEQCGSAKLTNAQVKEIRNRYDGKRGSASRLAREYDVSKSTVSRIVKNIIWRNCV